MGKLKAIIFDVDGTLADTERDGHLAACNEAFARMGFDIRWTWEEFKELLRVPGNANRMRLALSTRTSLSQAEIDRIVPELFALKKEIYLKRVADLPLRGREKITGTTPLIERYSVRDAAPSDPPEVSDAEGVAP